jgi:GNAT superfamily N-acetyltransferase
VEYDTDARRHMFSGPNCRPELGRVVIAPDGEYACMAGMWLDEVNRYAYLEPLCTVPEHRRRGLAAHALTEAMRATAALGAEYCFGGVVDFYTALGFETVCRRRMRRREWSE